MLHEQILHTCMYMCTHTHTHIEIIIEGHTGIVKCLAAMGTKVYSAGFDSKLIVHEASSMPGEMPLKRVHINHAAHNAGVTCMLVAKDTDSSTW